MNTNTVLRAIVFCGVVLMLVAGCGTRQGNGLVSVELEPLGAVAWHDWLLPRAWASSSEVKLCFDRIRFKRAGGEATSDDGRPTDFQFRVGEITVNASGTTLGNVALPPGEYRRVELVLADVCGTGSSVSVTGASTVSTDLRIVLKFNGTFVADDADERLGLKIDAIVNAVETATNPGQIKVLAEGNSGTF
jgi:hypothetical protein